MARTFSSGTAVDGGGSVATNAATLQGLLRDAIIANGAWSLTDEFTNTGGTHRVCVFKCAAASSGLPKDFYVFLVRQITSGAFAWFMAEDYDAGTRVATNIPGDWVSGNKTFDANGFPNPATTASLAANFSTFANTPQINAPTINASMFWAVIADTDHLVLVLGTQSIYFGAITSFATGSATDPMPVGQARLSSAVQAPNSSAHSGMTRHPGAAGQTLTGNSMSLTDPGNTAVIISFANGIGFSSGPDKLHDNKVWAYEVAMVYSTNTIGSYGYIRGKLKKCAQILNPAAGTAVGDTYTMDGNKWLVVGMSTSAFIVDTGAP